ncbi:MAG: outer membrane beta-barrel protein [Myxococcota bacterium]
MPSGVTDRVAPNSDAMGTKIGGFTAYSRLGLSVGYDDNVLATENDEREDARFRIEAPLAIESNWSRHQLSMGGYISSDLYADETSQDNLEWGIGASGQVDLQGDSGVKGLFGYQQLAEPRGGINAVNDVPDPVEYDLLQFGLVGNHSLNQIDLSIGADIQMYDYDDGSQQYRDRDVWGISGQGGYSFSPGYSGFVRGVYNQRDFENPSISAGNPSQDSEGYKVVAGVASEITNLISGEVYVGYLDQDYDSGVFSDVDGVSFGLNLEWEVTKLTLVRATASRDVVDSTSPGDGGILYTIAGIGVEHELTPKIDLTGDVSYYNGDYEDSSREDDGYRVSAGVDYRLSSMIHVDLVYSYDDRDSNRAGQDYSRNEVTLGVTLQH